MNSPAPLLVHTPGYGGEMSMHPELAQYFNVLHINPLGYTTPEGKDENCPPETIENLFLQLKGTKSYTHFSHLDHGYNREFIQLVKAWFMIYA